MIMGTTLNPCYISIYDGVPSDVVDGFSLMIIDKETRNCYKFNNRGIVAMRFPAIL